MTNAALLSLCNTVIATGSAGIQSVWVGPVTDAAAWFTARVNTDTPHLRAIISENPNLSNPVYSPFVAATGKPEWTQYKLAKTNISGLKPDTQYYYGIMNGTYVDNSMTGRFHTIKYGPYSFTFGAASCSNTNTNHAVFNYLRTGENISFFCQIGDLHYLSLTGADINGYRTGFSGFFAASNVRNLYREVPHYYMYDDHDYGPNDSDKNATGRNACLSGYREIVNNPFLVYPTGDNPCYYSFVVGRCKFIYTDLRSMRSPNTDTDNSSKTILGSVQKDWFKNECMDAKNKYPVIFWMNTVCWNDTSTDAWAGYTTERTELSDFFRASGISGLILVHGDMHCLAADDGSHNDFRTGGSTSGFCATVNAPLDNSAASRATWSQGTVSTNGNFGKFTVKDGGNIIQVDWEGKNSTGATVLRLGTSSLDTPRNGKMHKIQIGKVKIV